MEIAVGAYGWEHASWRGDFYPDDLPEDWRLGYYANEFPTVMLPWRRWSVAPLEMLGAWVDDVHERFSFVLELDVAELDSCEHLEERVARFPDSSYGVLLNGSQVDCTNERIGKLAFFPECSAAKYRADEFVERAWCPATAGGQGAETTLMVNCDSGIDLLGLRQLLESVLGQSSADSRITLVFSGQLPSVALMRNTQSMIDLMIT